MEKLITLLEYLDRTGQHIPCRIFEKYRDENHNYSEWVALII